MLATISAASNRVRRVTGLGHVPFRDGFEVLKGFDLKASQELADAQNVVRPQPIF